MKKLISLILCICMIACASALTACELSDIIDENLSGNDTENEKVDSTESGKTTDAEGNDSDENTTEEPESNTNTGDSTENDGNDNDNSTESKDPADPGKDDEETTTDAAEQEIETDKFLGKTPLELYTMAVNAAKAYTNYTLAMDNLMESTQSNYRSTRFINAKIADNNFYINTAIDYDVEEDKKEQTIWCVDNTLYMDGGNGISSTKISAEDAIRQKKNFESGYQFVMFNLAEEHFGQVKFAATSTYATVTLHLTAEQLTALTDGDTTADIKASDSTLTVKFDAKGNLTGYHFEWTRTAVLESTGEITEHLIYKIDFSDIGSTTVEAPEATDSEATVTPEAGDNNQTTTSPENSGDKVVTDNDSTVTEDPDDKNGNGIPDDKESTDENVDVNDKESDDKDTSNEDKNCNGIPDDKE